MKMILVTGTNGKTTVAECARIALNTCGINAASIGTLGCTYKEYYDDFKMTTPDPDKLHKLLKDLYSLGCEVVIMEASAHAIDLNKLYGISAEIIILTNVTRDHLDYFVSEEKYRECKKSLFTRIPHKYAVINGDDDIASEITAKNAVIYGKQKQFNVYIKDISDKDGLRFTLVTSQMEYKINSALYGEYNVYNLSAVFCICVKLGISPENAATSLCHLTAVSGRMECVENNLGINILIDFAHTPSALENVLSELKKSTSNRVIAVFGCGGDRDRGKRPLMGEVASKYSDVIFVTSDNPRGESQTNIAKEIVNGIHNAEYYIVEDRKRAIKDAIKCAEIGDTIIIAGKGAEEYMEIQGIKYPYRDIDAVREALKEYK